jgi:hypothetical protein
MTKLPTFNQARTQLQAALKAAGWTLCPAYTPQGRPYKVPYADSPTGRVRVWFKPQAVWYTVLDSAGSERHTLEDAHSFESDMRTLEPLRFAERFEEIALR